jgi:CYTH domain-containing protein
VPSEIEHKYLVLKEAWKPSTSGVLYRQGYLSSTKERVVRVRIAGDQAYLTVKGPTTGVTRLESQEPEIQYECELAIEPIVNIDLHRSVERLDVACPHPDLCRYRESHPREFAR